jgi:uncharacterized membrane protein YcjF (UPF0283 family)
MLDAINRALRLAGKKALGAILLLVGLVVVAIIASLAGELWDNYHTAILRILAALVFALFLSSTIGQRDFRRRFFASFRSGEDPREALASEEESIKPQVVAAREEITQEHRQQERDVAEPMHKMAEKAREVEVTEQQRVELPVH